MEFSHVSVLYNETLDALNIKPDGVYVDCTCGGAGHSSGLLERLSKNGRLIAIDQDPEAIEVINERIGKDERVTVVHDNFSNLKAILSRLNIDKVDGILADLGVSSHQLDKGDRGFSYNSDAPLDMRMSKQGMSAYDVVNTYSERDLSRILRDYGEEKFASRIARNIVLERENKNINTTFELAQIIKDSIPAATRRTGGHPAKRSFQAIRIEVNGELKRLEQTLDDMFYSLKDEGRLAIITFHSLEDRMVKHAFQGYCKGCECPPSAPVCICGKVPEGKMPFKKITASQQELESNMRSRSATLRCVEKIG